MTPGRRALVTGAAGFIGAHCVRSLAAEGWSVRCLDVHEAPDDFAALGVEFRKCDLRDRAAVGVAVADIDVVFHLASVHLEVGAPYAQFESVNVTALESLVDGCASAGVRRIVHVSSVGVYGHVEHPPADESAPLHPVNDYERTKSAGEAAARSAASRRNMDLVILRPSWVYGAGCPRTAKLMGALRKKRFFYIGPARNLRHPIHIDDFLAGMRLAALAPPAVAGSTFNIAGPRSMTVEEMVTTVAAAIGAPPPALRIPRWLGLSLGWMAEQVGAVTRIEPPISRRTLAFFENDNAFDISAARRELGFAPTVELLEGMRRVAQQVALQG